MSTTKQYQSHSSVKRCIVNNIQAGNVSDGKEMYSEPTSNFFVAIWMYISYLAVVLNGILSSVVASFVSTAQLWTWVMRKHKYRGVDSAVLQTHNSCRQTPCSRTHACTRTPTTRTPSNTPVDATKTDAGLCTPDASIERDNVIISLGHDKMREWGLTTCRHV